MARSRGLGDVYKRQVVRRDLRRRGRRPRFLMTIDYRPSALSFSASSTFKGCKKRWAYHYIYRRELVTTSYPTTIGSFVHKVFEYFYELEPRDRHIKNLQLIATLVFEGFDDVPGFRESDDFVMLYLPEDLVGLFKHQAWDYLTSIWEFEKPHEVEVVSTEMDFIEELQGTNGIVPVKGQIDRVEVDQNGRYVVSDYKTGKMPEDKYMYQKTPQIMLYSAVVKKLLGDMPSAARFLFLSNGIYEVTPNEKSVMKAVDKLVDIWQDIHTACEEEDFPASPQMLCGWCPHVDLCEEGQEKVEQLLRMGKMKETAPAIEMLDLYHLVR
jgi:putative RecB family exonuclease